MSKKAILRDEKGRFASFQIKSCEELAYVLGVYYGDGTVEDLGQHGKRISLFSTTSKFNESFEKSLRNIGLNPFRDYLDRKPYSICGKKASSRWKRVHRTVCYSTKLYELIQSLGAKRNINLKELKGLILKKRQYIINFLRGLYESDGSCRRHGLYIGGTNKRLMQFTKHCLSSLGFHFHWSAEDRSKSGYKTLYRIRLTRDAEITRFLKTINPCIKRGGYL